MISLHGILSLLVVAISKLLRLKGSTIFVVTHNSDVSFHHIVLPMLHILIGRLNPFLVGCIREHNFSLTTLIDIIGGRRVIHERDTTLCKGKHRSMISRPLPHFIRFWDRTFEDFSCLFVKHNTASRAEHYLRILQLTSIEKVNQFFLSCRIGCL